MDGVYRTLVECGITDNDLSDLFYFLLEDGFDCLDFLKHINERDLELVSVPKHTTMRLLRRMRGFRERVGPKIPETERRRMDVHLRSELDNESGPIEAEQSQSILDEPRTSTLQITYEIWFNKVCHLPNGWLKSQLLHYARGSEYEENDENEVLWCGHCDISDNNSVIQIITEMLFLHNHICVKKLSLTNNELGNLSATALAGALILNQTLIKLYLDNNSIGDIGAKAISVALRNNSTLDLWNNDVSDEGACALASAVKVNRTLKYLILWRNNIGDPGAVAFANAIKHNFFLLWLDLWGNSIRSSVQDLLKRAWKNSPNREMLAL